MVKVPQRANRDEFAVWVRSALHQLYDSPSLGTHLLAKLLTGDDTTVLDRAQNLRRLVLEAIMSLRPTSSTPADSSDWRAWRIVEMRYVDGLGPDEAMAELALAKTQFYLHQSRGVYMLTERLWARYQQIQERSSREIDSSNGPQRDSLHSEAERLIAQTSWQEIDACRLLYELRTIVEPLAREKDTVVHIITSSPLMITHSNRVLVRQAILNAITYGLDIAQGGSLEVTTFSEEFEKGIRIQARIHERPEVAVSDSQGQTTRLDVCHQLMAKMGGAIHLKTRGGTFWEARLVWRTPEKRTLLAIDDNQDLAGLFRRYLTGHDWRVIGASDGIEARQILAQMRPVVITLDVLMPQQDGWDLLTSLKSDPDTRDIPIIVCSVLNEPQLALSLGAAACLAKPVSEEALLHTLAPWSDPNATPEPMHLN